MTKKLFVLLFALMLIPSFMVAQKHMVLRADGQMSPNGVFKNAKEARLAEAKVSKRAHRYNIKGIDSPTDLNTVLFNSFDGLSTSNFGFFGQDWFVQWFKAPADMFINKAGFATFENLEGVNVSVKLVKVVWTEAQIKGVGVKNLGYYPAAGNGFNDLTGFIDNPDITDTNWVDVDGLGTSPFGHDLWSTGGVGTSVLATAQDSANKYQWVDVTASPQIQVLAGEIVGVAIQDDGDTLDAQRIGMWASNQVGLPGFKLYTNGRLSPGGIGVGDPGWWSRAYSWDFALDVTIFGDTPPDISDLTILPTTLSTDERQVQATVVDDNPGGGAAGVASAELLYTVDGGTTWSSVAMTKPPIGTTYTGVIPGQAPGTSVEYYVKATDVNSNVSESKQITYNVFAATSSTLLVFNGYGYESAADYPQGYYFGKDDFAGYSTVSFDHDVWAFGPLTADLLSNYMNVIEITTSGPNDINNDAISAWLDANPAHNYALFGDEWIGSQTNWTDSTYAAGDFFYDILGIQSDHNDISYLASGDQSLPSDVQPIQGTLLGGPLFDKYTSVSTDSGWTAPMLFAPNYEIGVSNWLDGVDFLSDVEVDMTATARDSSTTYSILGHRTLAAGNKVVFGAYDPLSLDSDIQTGAQYYWYGFSFSAPQVTLLDWFGIVTAVEDQSNDAIPNKYSLSQNYPNPFNPTTVIKFSISNNSRVTLKIYDVLGREVSTLLNNKNMNQGNYKVNFDASKLTSGVYIYQITAGDFVSAKKMMLLK